MWQREREKRKKSCIFRSEPGICSHIVESDDRKQQSSRPALRETLESHFSTLQPPSVSGYGSKRETKRPSELLIGVIKHHQCHIDLVPSGFHPLVHPVRAPAAAINLRPEGREETRSDVFISIRQVNRLQQLWAAYVRRVILPPILALVFIQPLKVN